MAAKAGEKALGKMGLEEDGAVQAAGTAVMEQPDDMTVLKEILRKEILQEMAGTIDEFKRNIKEEFRAELEAEVRAEVKQDEKDLGATIAKLSQQKRYRIIINEQENTDTQNGRNDVFVACNGAPFLIKRGHEVVVPEGILNVLQESRPISVRKNPEDDSEILREFPRFALTVIGEVVES